MVDTTTERLRRAGCESPRVDAELLVGKILGLSRSELALERSQTLSASESAELERLVVRREAREPLAYVLGEWGFRRLTLTVDARVLVPRPETEVVVERCLARIAGLEAPRILDVGTGSGAIALAIADEHPGAQVTAIDASPGALEVASANATRTGIAIELAAWDLFSGLPPGPWDLVVSNPPYVLPEEIDSLQPEVRDWEPRGALVGVGATEAVAHGALDVLRPGGALVLEVAADDAGRVEALLHDLGYRRVAVTADLAGRDRVVEAATCSVADAAAVIAAGGLVVLPTDTVYGLACRPDDEDAVRSLSRLKQRSSDQPIALVAASVEALRALVPEIPERGVLTGPFTTVVPNPERRLPWLTGRRPETIGVRVPDVAGAAAELLAEVGVVAATSANLHGGRDPRRVDEVPKEILEAVGAALRAGQLPGTPSTVIDLTGPEPRVLREGAVPAAEALARIGE